MEGRMRRKKLESGAIIGHKRTLVHEPDQRATPTVYFSMESFLLLLFLTASLLILPLVLPPLPPPPSMLLLLPIGLLLVLLILAFMPSDARNITSSYLQALIPGLPDDIALDCLARVPHRFHSGLRLVCYGWRDLATAPCFYQHRERIGAAEDLIFLVQALVKKGSGDGGEAKEEDEAENGCSAAVCSPPTYGLSVYNATEGSWHRVVMAEPVPLFAHVVAVGGKLVMVGGWDPVTLEPVAEVRVLDLARGEWRRGAAMTAARSFFACAAVAGRVYVAGGHDAGKNALREAEAYDAAADQWAAMPAMGEERDECKGVAAGGQFWAVSGYGTEEQGMFGGAAERYDEAAGEWRREEGVSEAAAEGGSGGGDAAYVGVSRGRMWSVECGGGRRGVREYAGSGRGWKEVAPLPEGAMSRPCAAAMGGGERVFLMAATTEGNGSGPHRGWILEAGSANWARVETPVRFSGFAYSAAAVRL
ncbi:unnamed protein product [Musa acuminata var. zebrina]